MANVIPVVELFGPTVQGEGAVIGYQTCFVRTAGCDYLCKKCDSLHAVLPELFKGKTTNYKGKALNKALAKQMGHCKWVTLSGGNPCMWDFTDVVADPRWNVALETQGTLWKDWIRDCDIITVSPKGPGMGEQFEPDKFDVFVQNLTDAGNNVLHKGFFVKVVVFEQRDIELCVEIMDRWPILKDRMYLSQGNPFPPAPLKEGEVDPDAMDILVYRNTLLELYKESINTILADPRLASVKILPQLHTLVWGNDKGV